MGVAEELLDVDHTIDRAYVERRLEDRDDRLDRLSADVQRRLPDQWSRADVVTKRIHVDTMQRFNVPERCFPVEALLRQHKPAGRLEPRGLWIIGANARIDLIPSDAHDQVVDRVDCCEPSNRRVAGVTNRREQRSFDRAFLSRVLR